MRSSPVAGTPVLHPLVLAAIVVLALNDHWAKAAWPGWITGKVSDVAGMVCFPVLVAALLSEVGWASPRVRGGVVVLTGVVFALMKTVSLAAGVVEQAFVLLQAPLQAIGLLGAGLPTVVVDPTDLVALPFLWVAARILRGEARGGERATVGCASKTGG